MTSRTELLDLIASALAERLGVAAITRRADGVIVVGGSSEAFAVQAFTIEVPDFADPDTFGQDLVEFIRSRAPDTNADRLSSAGEADPGDSDGEAFYTSENGDRWLLATDSGGRRFVRHLANAPSGGAVEVTDLQAFLDQEPHSPQNQAVRKLLHLSA
jgi:hypothetical protein